MTITSQLVQVQVSCDVCGALVTLVSQQLQGFYVDNALLKEGWCVYAKGRQYESHHICPKCYQAYTAVKEIRGE